MAPVLAKVISPHQHGFIKGRSIYDNILAAMIGMEYAKFKKQECILLQLDLDKAYDRITWSFVQDTLQNLGFGPRICQAVKTLGGGSSSELLFNSRLVGSFDVKRSIRQGCPLAPLWFAACTHPLIALMEQAAERGEITGLQIHNAK